MNKEQEFLVQKAQDSLRAAKILAGENLADFAASRAYYAMFYIVEAFLVSENLSFSKINTDKDGQSKIKTWYF